MDINKGKCSAWISLMFALLKMSKELNESERKYIKASFSIALGNLELEEMGIEEV